MTITVNQVSFNGTELTSIAGLTILSTDPYKMPKRDVNLSNISRSSKSVVNSGFYDEKEIVVRVGIARSSRESLEQTLDQMFHVLQPTDKVLIVKQGVGQRKYFASFADADVRVDGGAYQELELIFVCTDRYGYDLEPATLDTIGTTTSSTTNGDITTTGSAEWQQPVFTFTWTSITGGTGADVTVGNSGIGQSITINRDWDTDDVLEVDSYNKTVKVNGIEVDYSGVIPEFKTGDGNWYYTDTFTTRTFTGTVTCTSRYA